MSGTNYNSRSKSNFDILTFDDVCKEDADHDVDDDLSQIRNLFIDGMRINDAPEDYIEKSLQSDLNDASSMRDTYFSGKGTFLMLAEDEDDDDEEISSVCDSGKRRRRKSLKGIVGLADVSSGADSNGTSPKKDGGKRLCELRRMSIHSSRRRSGYGAKLVKACISHAKENKFDGIKLYTGAWMEAAINFYTKMGFEDMGRMEYKHDDGSTTTIAHLEMIFDDK
eukprot:CAMPEP_0172315096 /NCGR_PEP_ID=MMETSP1058-20130122/24099_1 /TAXON_ID=83371 /ORGANISM="Detonula confervacea, Strain CCMP 353" /LENGTH=223 /DNA_ID=CAMNT_0013029099 /DNA_START=246 /DNA_END=917 /DNA_ORIENTATION=-